VNSEQTGTIGAPSQPHYSAEQPGQWQQQGHQWVTAVPIVIDGFHRLLIIGRK